MRFGGRSARTNAINNRQVVAEGLRQSWWDDLYHVALGASWPRFLAALVGVFGGLNFLFATLYALGSAPVANARPGSYADLFFFSVETISTTGYGDMHPQTFYGHCVATSEIFVSLVATAAMTGLVFARFSRPRAKIIFARNPVVMRHDGVDTLMVRLANARESLITEATAKAWMLGPSLSAEGRRFIGFRPMRLLRSENPAFALSWTLFHPIDEDSPLYGKSREDTLRDEITIVVTIAGLDERSSQTVHVRQAYAADSVRWGHEFLDMFHRDERGRAYVDFSKIHETQVHAI
jgi:inward rectifier potassium channel